MSRTVSEVIFFHRMNDHSSSSRFPLPARSLVAVDLFKREYHRRHFHGEKEQRAAAVCVRKRNIIYLNVQVEQFYERTRERKKERETSSLMKFDESWTIFTFPSLSRIF